MDQRSLDKLFSELQAILHFVNLTRAYEFEGYLFPIEGYALMYLAEHGGGQGVIVEIGSFKGRSTCWLAAGAKEARGEKVYAVDHFCGSLEHQPGQPHQDTSIVEHGSTFPEFQQNIRQAELEEYVAPLCKASAEAVKEWRGPIRLLFIDGDHSYEAVRQDFELWTPFLIRGGILCLHDVGGWPGVTQFHDELAQRTEEYESLFQLNSLAVFRKLR